MKKAIFYALGVAFAFAMVLLPTPQTQNTAQAAEISVWDVTGSITAIDPNGMYITIKVDKGAEKTFYLNKNTVFRKNSSVTDISAMFTGDRVALRLVEPNSTVVAEVDIQLYGSAIENVYRGDIRSVNSSMNRITVRNQSPFENWSFHANVVDDNLSTMAFQSRTPIYVGNKRIQKTQLSKYINSPVYYATVKNFGKEIITKMVVLENNERTYYERMTAADASYKFVTLQTAGRMYFHDGSILVRNGRLVEPTALTMAGTSFVVTDGTTRDNLAHVVEVTNDSFTSANFAKHDLYFGKLAYVDGYRLELNDAVAYKNNQWRYTKDEVLSFSNSTTTLLNDSQSMINLFPEQDLIAMEGEYGYFYIKDGHVQAIHFLEQTQQMGTQTVVGKISDVQAAYPGTMNLNNVSQWKNSQWVASGQILNMNIDQAMILKAGKVIPATELRQNDRVVVITDTFLGSDIILVD